VAALGSKEAEPKKKKPKSADEIDGKSEALLPQMLNVILARSPYLVAFLLMVFLWYSARQDALADRQILSGLIQSFTQQQTETLRVLKDVAVRENSKPGDQIEKTTVSGEQKLAVNAAKKQHEEK
jgi:hypothetical protein